MTRSRIVPGLFALALWGVASSMAACIAEAPTPVAGESESVGQAEQAVGVGGLCSSTSQCDSGLTCCWTSQPFPHGNCRDLNNDDNNCGACGNSCGMFGHCSEGVCCLIGYEFIDGECRKLCSAGNPSCPSGQTCCTTNGYCSDLTDDDYNCGSCSNKCKCGCDGTSCGPC